MDIDFPTLIRQTSNARLRLRYLAISHFLEGKNRAEIARFLKVSRTSVNGWVKLYQEQGIEALSEKHRSGRPSRLTLEQREQVKTFVVNQSTLSQGGRLQGKDVQIFIQKTFGIPYQRSMTYKLLHQLGLSWITARSKHPKQSQRAQDEFKKF